jgi:hypothetical protein
MWNHLGDGPSDDSSNESSPFEPHTESTPGQPSVLLRLEGELKGHSNGKLTILNIGLTELLGTLISDCDNEKMVGEMSIGEIM